MAVCSGDCREVVRSEGGAVWKVLWRGGGCLMTERNDSCDSDRRNALYQMLFASCNRDRRRKVVG